ncbi:MAG: ribosome-associated translation inhibitor RaiA [Gordonia sp. (in: high G+C Gram-positive bacteria)]
MSHVIHRKGQRESKIAVIDEGFDPEFAFVRPPGTFESDELSQPVATVVFNGRNVEIPEHYRLYVADKLARLERFDPSLFRFDVELSHERNRRQAKVCQRVEITAIGRGPVARAQSCGENFYAALESTLDKLESRLRRVKDRRRVHYGNRTPISVAEATEIGAPPLRGDQLVADVLGASRRVSSGGEPTWDDGVVERTPGQVVRIKEHPAAPMSVDEALYEMELVGHDFFLFHDKDTDRASVVYRRHAFDYGLIRLA